MLLLSRQDERSGNRARQPLRPYGRIVAAEESVNAVFPAIPKRGFLPKLPPPHAPDTKQQPGDGCDLVRSEIMKIAKTADRKKVMDTSKSTDCPKCGKPTRIVKRMKDRERGVSGGIFISCSACEFFEKL